MKQTFLRKHAVASMAAAGVVALVITQAHAGRILTVPSQKYHSIGAAMAKANRGDTIRVEPGVYRERVIMSPEVVLKSRLRYRAVLDGGRHGTVVSMSRKSSLIGFEIRNGTFGVFTSGFGNSILQCRIVYNWQTGIINVRNLARVEDNVIAFNGASGIQTWDVGVTSGTINHNTIAFNGNHGISLGGKSSAVIENNVIAFNYRFGIGPTSPRGEWRIAANNVHGNLVGIWPLPEGNSSFDPKFRAPRGSLDFRLGDGADGKEVTLDHEVIGARITN